MRSFELALDAKRASHLLQQECMARLGFRYDPPEIANIAPPPLVERRYGYVYDEKTAQVWGYHVVPEPIGSTTDVVPEDPRELLALTGMSADLENPPALPNGLRIPDGGCIGEARETILGDGVEIGLADIVRDINHESFERSVEDVRVIQAFEAWSACMKTAGYSVHSPLFEELPSNIDLNTERPSAYELTMAQKDVECQKSTNVTHIWFDVEGEIQELMISEATEALGLVARQEQAVAERVALVLKRLETK